MKYLFALIATLSLSCCQDNPNPLEKIYDPEDIANLSLEELSFWDSDSLISRTNYFDDYLGYIGGTDLKDNGKSVGVAVFETQEIAIESMQGRINTVAIPIKEGGSSEFLDGKWWYVDILNSSIYANQWNTILEVTYRNTEYEEVETLLLETASEISKRIDLLSQKQ